MVSFLDPSQLRAKIAKGFKGKLLIGTLTRSTGTTVDSYGDPVTSNTVYTVEGFNDEYSEIYRAQAGVPETDSKVTLILGNCEVDPIKDDLIKFPNWPSFKVRKVKIDPARAHAECQSFQVGS